MISHFTFRDFKFFISVKKTNGLVLNVRNGFKLVFWNVFISKFKITLSTMLSFNCYLSPFSSIPPLKRALPTNIMKLKK